ncbi:hypothetical protein [Stenomitos frigidus]|uniref:hypothetical protein n=1 Tax=Stenomitos frigidus TaxID=1886765 RepID=UPI0015E696B5|nr:hypothetical protein [Stenomitos frigidus]
MGDRAQTFHCQTSLDTAFPESPSVTDGELSQLLTTDRTLNRHLTAGLSWLYH